MTTDSLVILKNSEQLEFETCTFRPNHFYRHRKNETQHLVHGVIFDDKKFNELFELAHTKVLRDFKAIGLLPENNKPVSKTKFTSLADIHLYGRNSRTGKNIWFFRKFKDMIYGFYPMQGTKVENQKECYQWYLELIEGNVSCLDEADVQFGNTGIPIGYGNLRVW